MWHRGEQVNFFCNQLMDALLSMLRCRNRKLIPVSTRPQNIELEKLEVETLRYIAEFIVFSLKKFLYLTARAQSQTMTLVLPGKNTQMLG